jgi:hypothetical protein
LAILTENVGNRWGLGAAKPSSVNLFIAQNDEDAAKYGVFIIQKNKITNIRIFFLKSIAIIVFLCYNELRICHSLPFCGYILHI